MIAFPEKRFLERRFIKHLEISREKINVYGFIQ